MAIYVGAGGVKTPTAIYVGAGGVKTVSAVYVGVGSVKQVWPAYTVGSNVFDITSDYWQAYYTPIDSSGNVQSWTTTSGTFSSSGMSATWSNGCRTNCGVYFASKQTINASAIQYLGVCLSIYDTHTNSTAPRYDIYCSVGSSMSGFCSSDSGYGSYSNVTAHTSSSSPTFRCFLINLTNCTRTGYLKIGEILSANRTTDLTDHGTFQVYNVQVGNSTSFSSYSLAGGSSFISTITVT